MGLVDKNIKNNHLYQFFLFFFILLGVFCAQLKVRNRCRIGKNAPLYMLIAPFVSQNIFDKNINLP